MDADLYSRSAEEAAKVKQVPGNLEAVLDALENDNEFLDVFTPDPI
jgi:glutamine synthetase